ncbi:hypothetical protein M0811_02736 [Anaeramoeba ignava]|uniref:GOLD domain-containing protein n=1 Tax=Anaeramoeba ignava TaxID=1746090 RepID=A0A9Q0L7K9_ANAIG|nr:hypothetical protein M0811_02736 [Anaeramoeba ignava]
MFLLKILFLFFLFKSIISLNFFIEKESTQCFTEKSFKNKTKLFCKLNKIEHSDSNEFNIKLKIFDHQNEMIYNDFIQFEPTSFSFISIPLKEYQFCFENGMKNSISITVENLFQFSKEIGKKNDLDLLQKKFENQFEIFQNFSKKFQNFHSQKKLYLDFEESLNTFLLLWFVIFLFTFIFVSFFEFYHIRKKFQILLVSEDRKKM